MARTQTLIDDGDTITRNGFTLTLRLEPDHQHSAPWIECDGHGTVSEWTSRDKLPGELLLSGDSRGYCGTDRNKRYYDFAAACATARREQWGSLWPYTVKLTRTRNGSHIATARAPRYGYGCDLPDLATQPRRDINRAIRELYTMREAQFPSARAYHANAARGDYEYLRSWCNDDWSYIGVIVTASRNGIELASDSVWGIESSDADYIAAVAAECASAAIDEARDAIKGLA